jgi:hypothetical protein
MTITALSERAAHWMIHARDLTDRRPTASTTTATHAPPPHAGSLTLAGDPT